MSRHYKVTKTFLFIFLFWLFFFFPIAFTRVIRYSSYLLPMIRLPFLMAIISKKIQKFKLNRFWLFMILFLGWNSVCIIYNTPRQMTSYLVDLYNMLEVIIVIYCTVKKYGIDGLRPLLYVSNLYIVGNFLSMILFKDGIYRSTIGSNHERGQWLFGSKNNIPTYIILFCIIVVLFLVYDTQNKKHISKYVLKANAVVLMGCWSVISAGENHVKFMDGSSTGIVTSLLIIALIVYINIGIKRDFFLSILNLCTPLIILIVIFVLNAFILGGSTISFISNFVENVLHKNMTFTNRAYIWANVLPYILRSPILGHGYTTVTFWTNGATSTYNVFLGMIKSFGIPSAFLYICSLLSIRRTRNTETEIMIFGLFVCLINGLMSEVDILFLVIYATAIFMLGEVTRREGFFNETKK